MSRAAGQRPKRLGLVIPDTRPSTGLLCYVLIWHTHKKGGARTNQPAPRVCLPPPGIGVLHWNGMGGEQNMTAAYEAFMKGAAFEHSDSLFNLGML